MQVVSADQLQLSMIEEVTPGVTPASPAMNIWRTTGESLTFTPNTSESGELAANGRSAQPPTVTGVSVTGDINFRLTWFQALKDAIAGVMAASWGYCPLGGAFDSSRVLVGDSKKTFTLEKRFPNPNFTPGGIGAMTFVSSGAPGASVTITVGGGPAVGTGVVEMQVVVDAGPVKYFSIPIAAGDTNLVLAATTQTILDADSELTAVDNLDGTVTLTTSGTQIDSVAEDIGTDDYLYQWYRGSTFSALNLATSPNNEVTGSVSVIGGIPMLGSLPIAGVTYVQPVMGEVFTAPEVLALEAGAYLGKATHCYTSLDITLDSLNRGIGCIGYLGEKGVVLGTLQSTVAGDVYFADQDFLKALLRNETLGDGAYVFSNVDGEILRFDFFSLKATAGDLTAGGTGEDLTIPVEMQPTPVNACDDGATGRWQSSVIISTVNSKPTLP